MNKQQRWILTFGCAVALFLAILPGCYNPIIAAQAKAKDFCKTAKFWKVVSMEQETTASSSNDKLVIKLVPAMHIIGSDRLHYDEKGHLQCLRDTEYFFDPSEQREIELKKGHSDWYYLSATLKVDGIVEMNCRSYLSSVNWTDYISLLPKYVSAPEKSR